MRAHPKGLQILDALAQPGISDACRIPRDAIQKLEITNGVMMATMAHPVRLRTILNDFEAIG